MSNHRDRRPWPPTPATCAQCQDRNIARQSGRHAFALDIYASDPARRLGNSEGLLAELGIDMRGNGHVVAAPSPHKLGGRYQWHGRHLLDFGTIPDVPPFIYQAVGARTPPQHRPPGVAEPRPARPKGGTYQGEERPNSRLFARLASTLNRISATPEGRRHDLILWASCLFGEFVAMGDLTEEEAVEMLVATTDQAGWDNPKKTLETIVYGIRRTGGTQ